MDKIVGLEEIFILSESLHEQLSNNRILFLAQDKETGGVPSLPDW
jgi:hypothetical protein